MTLSQKLTWNEFLLDGKQNLYKQLKTRISALKKLRTFIDFSFAKNLANALFIGKFNYAAEIWGGAPIYIIKKFQALQLEAGKGGNRTKSFLLEHHHFIVRNELDVNQPAVGIHLK